MKEKLKNFLSTHGSIIEASIVSAFLIFASSYNFINSCQSLSTPVGDNQILATWKFTAINGNLPYKDIYYPYGLLRYLKHVNFYFSLISIFLTPLLFLSVYVVLRKIWIKRWIVYSGFIAFLAFVSIYTDIEVFERYGVIVSIALFLAYLFWKQTYCSKRLFFLNGIIIGIIFPLIPDQGVYGFVLSVLLLFLNPLLRYGVKCLRKKQYYQSTSKRILVFSLGLLIGFMPFALFFAYHGMLSQFIFSIQKFSDFSIYGKTPFIPYSSTIDNVFNYIPLIIGLFVVLSRTLFIKTKFTFSYYVTLLLLFAIILLEQKSIIRSISTQITFISFLLIFVLAREFDQYLISKAITARYRFIFYVSFLAMVFTIRLEPNNTSYSSFLKPSEIFLSRNLNNTLTKAYKACLSQDTKNQVQAYSGFNDVINIIKSDPADSKIFVFLTDPLFYVLLQQTSPYYMGSYEGGPLYAQIENIKYIEKRNINYIIYNYNFASISDGVPAYARSSVLLKYIFAHFKIIYRNDKYLVFKKENQQNDLFIKEMKNFPELKKEFLNINLAAIPKSEGLHKTRNLKISGNEIISNSNLKDINEYLSKNNILSSNKLLILKADNYLTLEKDMSIKLVTADKLSTEVTFYRCEITKPCIITISNLPLFYNTRTLKEIWVDKNFKGKIELINNQTDKELW